MTRRFLIISGILTFVTLFLQIGLTGWIGGVQGIFDIIICGCIATFIGGLLRKEDTPFRLRCLRSSLIFGSFLGVLSSIILIFIIYQNLFPAAVGKIILSNNKQEIVFLQMSHIATPAFYDDVKGVIHEYSQSGYTVYAEGVRPGSPESLDVLNRALGIEMTESLYASIAKVIGLDFQDESIYSQVASGAIENVDISIDDIAESLSGRTLVSGEAPIDIEAELSELGGLSQDAFLVEPLIRAFLNYSLSADGLGIESLSMGLSPEVMDAILHKRNTHIVHTFLTSGKDTVIMVYGALHFQGVYDLLKADNPDWHIVRVDPLYPYSYPYVK